MTHLGDSAAARYRYSAALYAAQIAIVLGAQVFIVWGLADAGAILSLYALVALAISALLWRGMYEVYQSPREIVVDGGCVRTRTFGGIEQAFRIDGLTCTGRRHPLYGSYDVYQADGRLAFRIYVWHSRYRELCRRMQPAGEPLAGSRL